MYTNEQVTKNRMFISIFSINLLNLNSIFPLFMNAQLSTTMAGGFGNQSQAESCNYTCYLYLCTSMWEKSHKTANILIQSIGSGIFFQVNHFPVCLFLQRDCQATDPRSDGTPWSTIWSTLGAYLGCMWVYVTHSETVLWGCIKSHGLKRWCSKWMPHNSVLCSM